jgi:hypothetical protein
VLQGEIAQQSLRRSHGRLFPSQTDPVSPCSFAPVTNSKAFADITVVASYRMDKTDLFSLLRKQNWFIWGAVLILAFIAALTLFFGGFIYTSFPVLAEPAEFLGLAVFGISTLAGMIFASMALMFNVSLFTTRDRRVFDPERNKMRFLALVTTSVSGFWIATTFGVMIVPNVAMLARGCLAALSILVSMEISRQLFSRYISIVEERAIVEASSFDEGP